MRILVTGANGFVGRHALHELGQHGHTLYALDASPVAVAAKGVQDRLTGDIRDAPTLHDLVRRLEPEACLHLAGLAYVPQGWTETDAMFAVNVMGTFNVLQAFRTHQPQARVLVVTTAQVYGAHTSGILSETAPLAPETIYAISKAAADQVAQMHARQCGLRVVIARPNNHIGAGQPPLFAVPAFARQVRAIAAGAEPVLRVGNLASQRDFSDVRDVVRAYRLLLEQGRPGEAYNIGAGRLVTLRDILDRLCALAGVRPKIESDEKLFRPEDRSPLLDVTKLHRDTGWQPEIGLDATLRDILAAAA